MATERDGESAVYRAIGSRVDWYLRYAADRHTQSELGELLSLDQSTVSKKLRGERPFSLPELYKTAVWLGRQVSDFIPSAEDLAEAPPLTPLRPPRARRRASVSAAAARDAAINSQASDGDTHQYVAFDRDYGFSHNVTSDQMYARVA
jgi:transcriptional regulator with XRE-family HTH domain